MRAWLFVLVLLVVPGCPPDPNDPYRARGKAIRECIEDNLVRGAHLQKAANADTVAAVRAFVTQADVHHLLELLGSGDGPVATTAQLVLEDLGEPVLPYLRRAADSPSTQLSSRAAQAVATIETKLAAERPDSGSR